MVHYKAKLGQQACEAPKGTLLLSQFRLVLCESGEQPSSSSIAIPLYHIYDEVPLPPMHVWLLLHVLRTHFPGNFILCCII